MKNTISKRIGAFGLAFLMSAILMQVSVSAQYNKDEQQTDEQTKENLFFGFGERIVGTWEVQVTIRNCQTGDAVRTFSSVSTFNSGGTLIDSTSGISQALRTPGHGVWSHINRNNFRFSFKVFNFDAAGNSTGWQIVRHQAQINPWGDELTSAGTATMYNPQGVLLFAGCSTTTATRFE